MAMRASKPVGASNWYFMASGALKQRTLRPYLGIRGHTGSAGALSCGSDKGSNRGSNLAPHVLISRAKVVVLGSQDRRPGCQEQNDANRPNPLDQHNGKHGSNPST